eukprot:8080050-Pyramimonas_sp.AAC.1
MRLRKFAGRSRRLLSDIDWPRCLTILRRCPPSWAWAALRARCDGWVTSSRVIPPCGLRACACGCIGKLDSLRHYARCPVLRRAP